MKTNTILMLGAAAIGIYYLSQQSKIVQIAPAQGLPYGGYTYKGILYAYDENGNSRAVGSAQ